MVRRLALACCAWLAANCAQAQVAGSVALVSDYRFRGVSVSDGTPALQLDADWTGAQGWYAGAFASSARLPPRYAQGAQWQGYAGYARRIDSRWNWEAGVTYTGFTRDHAYDYAEAYAGLISAPLSVRVHWSPHYFGYGPAVTYLEADGVRELSPHWRLLGHIGVLYRAGDFSTATSRCRYDARVGIGLRAGAFDLQLAAVAGGGSAYYAFGYPATNRSVRNTVVLDVSRSW